MSAVFKLNEKSLYNALIQECIDDIPSKCKELTQRGELDSATVNKVLNQAIDMRSKHTSKDVKLSTVTVNVESTVPYYPIGLRVDSINANKITFNIDTPEIVL